MSKFILASGSKTRAEILRKAGVKFQQLIPVADEDAIKADLLNSGAPARMVADALAETKARTMSYVHPEALVLGADQIMVCDGKVFSKATTLEEARNTLLALSGKQHQLISAAVVCQNGEAIWRHVDSVKLSVRPLSNTFIDRYLTALGEDAFWSVGCYQLEGIG
ncbi:MAG: nucleoside triphosphate pyrophosphatase, partial [Kordiimonas sp.]